MPFRLIKKAEKVLSLKIRSVRKCLLNLLPLSCSGLNSILRGSGLKLSLRLSLELLNHLYSFVCFLPFALFSVKSVSQTASGDELKPLPSVSVHNFVHYSSEGCILYGETCGVDKISLREICLGGHGEVRDIDTFLIGGQFLDTAEPSIFLFFADPQPVWVYTISQQPVPLAHGVDMDNSEWERLFNRVGGQTMAMAASDWLASSPEIDPLTQSAMNGSAAIGIELAAILGARLLFKAFGPDEDEQGWDYVWQGLFLDSADNPLMSLAINPALSEFVLRYLIHGFSAPLLLAACRT